MSQELTNNDIYHLFQRDPLGIKVWEDLCSRYYDVPSFDADNPHQTSFNEGQRSVFLDLMYRMNTIEVGEDSSTDTEYDPLNDVSQFSGTYDLK